MLGRWNLECLATLLPETKYNLGKVIIAATIFHVNNNELAGRPIASECMVS